MFACTQRSSRVSVRLAKSQQGSKRRRKGEREGREGRGQGGKKQNGKERLKESKTGRGNQKQIQREKEREEKEGS